MSDDERKAALQQAYAQMKVRFGDVLYEEDPNGIGASVGAPRDEYSDEAARLIVALRSAATEADVAERLSRMFARPSERLVHRVHQTWIEGGGPEW